MPNKTTQLSTTKDIEILRVTPRKPVTPSHSLYFIILKTANQTIKREQSKLYDAKKHWSRYIT